MGRLIGLVFVAVVLETAGCSALHSDATDTSWDAVIESIEAGDYTTYKAFPDSQFGAKDVMLVREMQGLFKCKEAYWWLIQALDSTNMDVARTAEFGFAASSTPGSITAVSLRQWYRTVPMPQWVYRGALWEPE